MQQYQDLISTIINNGVDNPDRTGTGTRSIFGHQMRFNLEEGFPLVTTKRTFWRGAFTEMLWMLRGDTNIGWLHEHNVRIWDEWADESGDLGPVYGAQWRNFNDVGIDQLDGLIRGLVEAPHSRRHIMSAWNPIDLPVDSVSPQKNATWGRMALAPCHCLVQFYVSQGRLSCQLYQRSADVFLGVPFNIAGYALLTHLLAYHLGMGVGEFIWTGGDCHLYADHFDQAKELLTRTPESLPELDLRHLPNTPLWKINPDQLRLVGYNPHPTIKAPVSV